MMRPWVVWGAHALGVSCNCSMLSYHFIFGCHFCALERLSSIHTVPSFAPHAHPLPFLALALISHDDSYCRRWCPVRSNTPTHSLRTGTRGAEQASSWSPLTQQEKNADRPYADRRYEHGRGRGPASLGRSKPAARHARRRACWLLRGRPPAPLAPFAFGRRAAAVRARSPRAVLAFAFVLDGPSR